MIMKIWRVVITTYTPICLECFLNDLMAHETSIEPMPQLKEVFGHNQVLCHNTEPFFSSFFVFHNNILLFLAAKVRFYW